MTKNKIGIVFSAFDLLHAGHVSMLREAKENCDFLIVGLQTDPTIDRPEKNKPIQSLVERFIQLDGCKYVDKIIPYQSETDLMEILYSNKIDIRFLGDDYEGKYFTGDKYCETKGIEIYYISREHSYSSTHLRGNIFAAEYAKIKAVSDLEKEAFDDKGKH